MGEDIELDGVELANDLVIDAIPGLPGVVVTVSLAASVRDMLVFKRIGEISANFESEQDVDRLDEALRRFGDQFLRSWNVKLRGEKVPANGAGLLLVPPRLQFYIVRAWLDAAKGIDAPLVEESANGAQSPEQPVTTGAW